MIVTAGAARGYVDSRNGHPFWVAPLIAVIVIAGLLAWPQIMYKPQVRTLGFGPAGLETSIRDRHRSYRWSDVATIEDKGDEVIVQLKNLNAFLIPQAAFEDKTTALNQIRQWWKPVS